MKNKFSYNFEDLKRNGVVRNFNRTGGGPDFVVLDDAFGKVQRVQNLNKNIAYIVKRPGNQQAVASIAASRMYGDLGIATPPVFILKSPEKYTTNTIQQDVTIIDNVFTTLAKNELVFEKINKQLYGKFKWQMFYDSSLVREFLKFMTPECLEQLQNVFLLDEIRTDSDRHNENYFFYRGKNSDKHEGVVVIDLENMMVFNYCGKNGYSFKDFLVMPYASATPQLENDYKPYIERVRDIREMIQDGVLSEKNIEALVGALKYDYPEEVRKVAKERNLYGKEKRATTEPVDELWEYNNKTIGKDLGL